MDFEEVLKKRKTSRNFSKRNVEKKLLHRILKLASFAPSAGGIYGYKIIPIFDVEIKNKIYKAAYYQESIKLASVVLVIFVHLKKYEKKYGKRGRDLYAINDGSIVGSYILLAATNFGLHSGWIGAFDEKKIHQITGMGFGFRPIAIISLGYPQK